MRKYQFVPTCELCEDRTMLATIVIAPVYAVKVLSSTSVQVSWNTVIGATDYWVDLMTNGKWTTVAAVGPTTFSTTISGLTPGTTYNFDVAYSTPTTGIVWEGIRTVTMPYPIAPLIVHPSTSGIYEAINGTLFGPNGPVYSDVHQGADLGDCWLLASLAEAADRDPQLIRNMFTYLDIYNENGVLVQLHDVHLFTPSDLSETILVDNEFAIYGGTEYNAQVVKGVLWVALAEKAYVEAASDGYVINSETETTHIVSDNYQDVNNGFASWA
jgi:Calpain family cysteine protease/Fibronectin type III domain